MNYFIIPARSGSKGVPDKNIRLLNNIPIIGHSVKTASESKIPSKIIVSSDSSEYLNISRQYGDVIGLLRNSVSSSDTSKDIDYLLHAVFKLDLSMEDLIIILRPTSPTRDVNVVDSAINTFIDINRYTESFHSLRSMHVLSEAPEKMFRMNEDHTLKPIYGDDIEITNYPRQFFDDAYSPNGYVDIVPVSTIIRLKTAYGIKIYGFITEEIREIDTIEDFKFLEKTFKK